MIIWTYSLVSVFLVGLVSLVGVATLSIQKVKLEKFLIYLVSMAGGAFLGDVFIHIIPEAYESQSAMFVSFSVIGGILLFFILEKVIRWRHCHVPESENHTHPMVAMNIVGDGVHNFIDGIVISASYMVSIELGIATTIAVLLHEIPQEIGDFGILVKGGLSVGKALLFNFASAIVAILGAIITLIIGPLFEGLAYGLLPFIAGGFLYIATSDIIPELHKSCDAKKSPSFFQILFLILGVALMASLVFLE